MSVHMKVAVAAVSAVCVLAAPRSAAAQIQQGDQSVQVQGQFIQVVNPKGEDPSGLLIGSYGYYFTQAIGAKVTAGVFFAADLGYLLGLGGEYNFGPSDWTIVPFAQLNLLDIKVSDVNFLMISPGGGVRFFLTRKTSFDVSASYNHALASFKGGSASGGAIQVLLGLSFYFGGGDKR